MLAWWDKLERWLIGALGGAGLLIYLMQIFGRYVAPERDLAWGEELTIYVIIWACLLSASMLVREDGHVRADLLLRLLPVERQRWIEVVNCIVAVLFCGSLAWVAYLMTLDFYELGEKSNTTLRFPMWLYYASLPTCAGLMTLRYAIRLWNFLFRYDPSRMAVHSGRES
jgi:C4-dicarboxylate transporter, DctQ subunit